MRSHVDAPPIPDELVKRALRIKDQPLDLLSLDHFLVEWRDDQTGASKSLENLSNSAGDPEFYLFFGMNEDAGSLLVYFFLPLKVRASSKGSNKFFLVIPAESFGTDVANPALSVDITRSSRHREPVTQMDEAGLEVGVELLRIRFTLRELGYATMPVPKAKSPMSAKNLGVLRGLRSLARARSFDVYVRNCRDLEEIMKKYSKALSERAFRTATIDFDAAYSGRSYRRDDWKIHGLVEDERMGPKATNSSLEDPPPDYEEAASSSPRDLKVASPNNDSPPKTDIPSHLAPDFSSRPLPPSSLPDTESAFGSDIEGTDDTQADYSRKRKAGEALSDGTNESGSGAHTQRLRTGVESLQHVPTGTCVTEWRPPAGSDAEVLSYSQGNEPQGQRDAQSVLDDEYDSAGPVPGVQHGTTEERRDAPLGSTRSAPSVVSVPDSEHRGKEQPQNNNQLPQKIILISKSSVIDGGANASLFDRDQYRFFLDALLWLRAAWKRQPDAHRVYLPELGHLMHAARQHNREQYRKVRVDCMTMLVLNKRESQSRGFFAYESSLDDTIRYVVEFVYGCIGEGTDKYIIHELTALKDAWHSWKNVGMAAAEHKEWKHRRLMFRTQIAVCVLMALYKTVAI
ncbi:hypothetical protein SLS56_010109 [Neofusicoccum ribis]|uniref:Uncharacterized protein n=1 Tax=Neofusicoccum ribis TaxID=45134 RepID=A0ABR3SFE2_9PEZI